MHRVGRRSALVQRQGRNERDFVLRHEPWFVAEHQPPHLAAICVWEGAADWYRDVARHGGICCRFLENLFPRAFHRVQHGLGERGLRSRVTGELVSGPETLSEEELRISSTANPRPKRSSCDLVGSKRARSILRKAHLIVTHDD